MQEKIVLFLSEHWLELTLAIYPGVLYVFKKLFNKFYIRKFIREEKFDISGYWCAKFISEKPESKGLPSYEIFYFEIQQNQIICKEQHYGPTSPEIRMLVGVGKYKDGKLALCYSSLEKSSRQLGALLLKLSDKNPYEICLKGNFYEYDANLNKKYKKDMYELQSLLDLDKTQMKLIKKNRNIFDDYKSAAEYFEKRESKA